MIALINRLASFSLVLALITTGYGCDVFLPDKGNEGQPCLDNGECKPGLVCQDGKCVEGSTDGGQTCQTDAECDDDNPCTADLCVQGTCANTNLQNGTPCDDDDTCTSDDACEDGVCTGTAKDCSSMDGLCKRGICFSDNGQCVQISADDGDTCDDGLYCTTGDQCSGGDCAGVVRDCDDGDDCTADDCDDIGDACQNVIDPSAGTTEGPVGDANCDNGVDDDCDGQTDQDDSECVACTGNNDCDDGNACTTDTCTAGQCTYQDAQNGTACDDNLYCTENDACVNGVCTGSGMDCRHLSDACNDGVCSEAQSSCVTQPKANGTACDDGLYCTVPDQCSNGVCQLNQLDCDDADSCTLDRCDEDNDVCENTLNPNPGAEGPYGDATCGNGVDDDCDRQTDLDDPDCVQCQTGNDCDDTNDCTLDECQAGGCTNTPQVGQGCNDGNDCTHTDQCTGTGTCQGTTIACVDDSPPCGVVRNCDGTDTCEEIYPGSSVSCDDTDPCTHTDRCDGSGSCAGTLITCQDDPPPCGMVRTCDGTAACDESYPGSATSCDDSDPCTYNDACNGSGDCIGTDNTSCTNGPAPCGIIRSCNGTAGCDESYPDATTDCDDGLFCTDSDRCDGAGNCQGGGPRCSSGWDCYEDEDQCCEPDVSQVCGANDNDVHYADSCGHEGGEYQNCPDPNGECVGAACQCIPHWTGQFCDACEDGWVGQDCEICVRYVDSNAPNGGSGLTWPEAFDKVQLAIGDAFQEIQGSGGPDVCEVWVVTGTYYIYENSRDDTVQLMPGVEVYGGFTATEDARDQRDWERQITVLNGYNQSHTNRVNHVVTGDDRAAIDGFVIYGGNASSASGGGMLNNLVSPRVENCVFLENYGQTGGGMANFDCAPIVKNCHFTRNGGSWGGGMNSTEASPFIDGCIFAGNNANHGGGLRSEDSGGYINNSIFVGNWVSTGAASMVISFETVANCTSTHNSPGVTGNAIGLLASPQFRNCVLWDTAAGDQTNHLGQADVQYSAVYVSTGSVIEGDGNIKSNPNFTVVRTGDTWASVDYTPTTYQTNLTSNARDYIPDEFKGMAIRPDIQSQPWYIVVGNDASSVYLWGDLSTAIQPEMGYEIVDLTPPDRSPVVDAGDACSAPDVDFFNRGRLDNGTSDNVGVGPPWVDMGAIERPIGNSSFPQDLLTTCCGAGQVHGTHTYHFCDDQVGWGTAVFRCAQYGSYLVSIGDFNENTFVANLINPGTAWIGANDILEENLWEWSTGEAWTYERWEGGQPDNSNNQDCAEMSGGNWLDTSCELQRSFVCEKPN